MVHKLALFALMAVLGCPTGVLAVPVTYQMKFTVLTGAVTTLTIPAAPGAPTIESEDAAGNLYYGAFTLDDAILLSDGQNKSAVLDSFYIKMEDNIWGYQSADNNSFAGFRGPSAADPTCEACLGAVAPGFDVLGGEIVNLRGGVYGNSDIPFVDFSLFGSNTFNAAGMPFFRPGSSSYLRDENGGPVFGSMEIFRVSEPGVLLLLAIGILVATRLSGRTRKNT